MRWIDFGSRGSTLEVLDRLCRRVEWYKVFPITWPDAIS